MNPQEVVVQGTLHPDGTLVLDQKPTLPAGRVRVTLTPEGNGSPTKEDTWTVLNRIWQQQKAQGFQGRTKEEIDADINALRDEWEERLAELERIHEEAERARGNPEC